MKEELTMDSFICNVCNSWDDNLQNDTCATCREN
jgi:hypothetical protein